MFGGEAELGTDQLLAVFQNDIAVDIAHCHNNGAGLFSQFRHGAGMVFVGIGDENPPDELAATADDGIEVTLVVRTWIDNSDLIDADHVGIGAEASTGTGIHRKNTTSHRAESAGDAWNDLFSYLFHLLLNRVGHELDSAIHQKAIPWSGCGLLGPHQRQ